VKAQKSLLVSARARGHIVCVARTIADLDGRDLIHERHIGEAVGCRQRDVDSLGNSDSRLNAALRTTYNQHHLRGARMDSLTIGRVTIVCAA
jgi:hypothetical protein